MNISTLTAVFAISVSVFLSGCGKNAPACDDSDSKELVLQILNKGVNNLFENVKNIRTESVDDKLLKTECAADIYIPSNDRNMPITYKLSITAEGELYAEVFWL